MSAADARGAAVDAKAGAADAKGGADAKPARKRDAEATRRALIDAAGPLFDERGYERATTREIGERAGVDPALIARYFGSKDALYLAVLADEERIAGKQPVVADLHAIAERIIGRWDGADVSPVRRALADPAPAEHERRVLLRRIMRPGVLDPAKEAVGDGDDAALRADLLLALLLGVTVSRSNGTLSALSSASRTELLRQLSPLLDALQAGPGASGAPGESDSPGAPAPPGSIV